MNNNRGIISELRRRLWWMYVDFTNWKYRKIYGMDIAKGTRINRSAHLDKNVNPHGVHIGENAIIGYDVVLLAHDESRSMKVDIWIGKNSIIGTRSIVMPGVRVGESSVVAAGSIVTRDVPNNCIVAGNPARVIKTGVVVERGKIIEKGVPVH